MTLHWADFALMMAFIVAGCGASYLLLSARLRRKLAENHREIDRRVAALTEAIAMGVPEGAHVTDAQTAPEIDEATAGLAGFAAAQAVVREAPAEPEDADISPETRAVIAAAVIGAFGNHAQVRSARRVPSSDVVSPWTQQGRVIVQSSHNLRTRERG